MYTITPGLSLLTEQQKQDIANQYFKGALDTCRALQVIDDTLKLIASLYELELL